MKKIYLIILICTITLTGCKQNLSIEGELINVQDSIRNKLSLEDYQNFGSCKVDEENKVVVVELINNSKEEQSWFKENIIDSELIVFKQGGPYRVEELEGINDTIIEYFASNTEYDNYTGHYLDSINKVVVVSLLDNSLEEQEKFKKEVIDSNLIDFKLGTHGIDQ